MQLVWDHERLKVYHKAIEAVVALDVIAGEIPAPRSELRDQLRRAASSIVLNIAEGASEYSLADKARFFRFARRSAAECAANLDLVSALAPGVRIPDTTRERLNEVAAMLTSLIKHKPAR